MENLAAPGLYAPALLPPAFEAAQVVTVYRVASAGYASAATDDPPHAVYPPRLMGDIEVGQSAWDGIGIGGRIGITTSECALWDADGQLAPLIASGTADGRAVVVRTVAVTDSAAGDFGTPLGSAAIAFRGLVRRVESTATQGAVLAIGDMSDRLNTPLQTPLFAGSGGVEGVTELAGRPKPVALGSVFNCAPVSLGDHDLGDGALPTYMVNWRAVEDITAVRIRGVAQTEVGVAPTVGQWRAWLSLGVFQLGSTPDGIVGADVLGDNVSTYVNSTAGILRRMLEALGPAYAAADFDDDAWTRAESDLPGVVGWFRGADEISAAAAVDEILAGCGAVLSGARDGRLRLWDPYASGEEQWTLGPDKILAIEPLPLPATLRPLPATVGIDWKPNAAPMTDFAGSVPDDLRALLGGRASGPARASSTAIGTNVRQVRELRLPGRYATEAEATTRAERLRTFHEAAPRGFRITTDRYRGQVEAGDLGRFAYPGFGLDEGASGTVLGWRESLAGGRLALDVITSPFVATSSGAIGSDFVIPVTSGLLGWWFLGDTVADTQHDYAGIADAVLTGSPVLTQGFVTFAGYAAGQWLQTSVTETAAFSIVVVARSSASFATSATRPMFVSNYGTDAGNGGVALGAGILVSGGTAPAGGVILHGGQNNNGTKQTQTNTTFTTTNVAGWNFYAGRLESVDSNTAATNNPRKLYNETAAQTATTNNYPRVPHSSNTMRIGAAYNSTFGGPSDIAMVALYSRALSDGNVDDIYDAVAARLLDRYGMVI